MSAEMYLVVVRFLNSQIWKSWLCHWRPSRKALIARNGFSTTVQLDLFETAHIRLECPYRLNQRDWKPTLIPLVKAQKRIETLFSKLTDPFLVIRNDAKITNGLFARIIGKISALTILQYVNYINNKPICRIKYALN